MGCIDGGADGLCVGPAEGAVVSLNVGAGVGGKVGMFVSSVGAAVVCDMS